MKLNSKHWNWELGVCEKHLLPGVPCPACIAEEDEDLDIFLEDTDILVGACEE